MLIKDMQQYLAAWKEEITTSNDDVVGEVRHFRIESAAIKATYDKIKDVIFPNGK